MEDRLYCYNVFTLLGVPLEDVAQLTEEQFEDRAANFLLDMKELEKEVAEKDKAAQQKLLSANEPLYALRDHLVIAQETYLQDAKIYMARHIAHKLGPNHNEPALNKLVTQHDQRYHNELDQRFPEQIDLVSARAVVSLTLYRHT